MMLVYIIKTLLMPPALQIIMCIISLICWNQYRFLSTSLLFLSILSLYALSLPIVSVSLHQLLEPPYSATTPEQAPEGVEAIVVLGAGRHKGATEYSDESVSHQGLWRLRYGAYLAKRWHLPIVVSGGNVRKSDIIPEAELSRRLLQNEFNIDTVWLETRSRSTWENAHFTKELLNQHGITKVILVTHGYHMRRSSYSFDQAGIEHIPMPTGLKRNQLSTAWVGTWLPNAYALYESRLALHEYLGLVFYRFK